MALERFIPKSPDPFIRNSQDFEVAKFGHLNTIIEYVNSYVVTDSLQLAGSGPITSTARYITDSLGNASAISISTIGVGIGTDAPTSLLDVVRYTTGSVNNNYQFRILNSADGQYPYSVLLLEHNNRTGIGNQGGAAVVIKDGFVNASRAEIVFDYANSGSFTAAGGNLYLSNLGQGNLFLATNGVNAVRVFKDQGVQIGGVSTNLSSIARLLVKGSGSTSATTSFLVQNSSGTEVLKITDNRVVKMYGLGINADSIEGRVLFNLSNDCIISTPTSFQVKSGITDQVGLYLNGNNGYVGVGTTTPTRNLQVNGIGAFINTDGNTALYVQNGNTGVSSVIHANVGSQNLYFGGFGLLTSGDATFGQLTSLSARVGIKGSGSTSATTSLLVQNSAGTNILKIGDGARIDVLGTIGQIDFSSYYQLFSTGNQSTVGCYKGGQAFSVDGSRLCVNVATGSHSASASFQVDSTTTGILPPRMTTTQKNAIATPVAGLVVYDTDLNKLCVYTTAWQTITSV